MGRPPLDVGTFGRVAVTRTAPGRFTARTRYRDQDGVVRKVEASGPSDAGARRALSRALLARRAPSGQEVGATTRLAVVITAWLADVETSERAAGTRQLYRSVTARYVLPRFGQLMVREVTVARLDRGMRELVADAGPANAKIARTVLTGSLSRAVRHDALAVNPMREVTPVRQTRREVVALSVDQVKAVREDLASDPRAVAVDLDTLADVLLGTGARIGEALALRWEDVDTAESTVAISGTVIRVQPADGSSSSLLRQDTTKGRKARAVRLPSFALAAVAAQAQRHPWRAPGAYVFPSAAGGLREVATVERQWRAWRGRHPLWSAVTFHSFRRTVATVIERGAGMGAASVQLGHSSERITAAHYVERASLAADRTALLGVFSDVFAGFPPDR